MKKSIQQILFDEVLPRVQKPGQYAGGERNIIVKDHASVDLKVALAFPDTYAIGMSHLGLRILYQLINDREDACAERVFAPWIDMEDELRRRELPLVTLETKKRILERAIAEDALIVSVHSPPPGIGRIRLVEGKRKWEEI